MISYAIGLLALSGQPSPEPVQAKPPAAATAPAAPSSTTQTTQTCVSRPSDMAAAVAALSSPGFSLLAAHLVYYRSARGAGLPECVKENKS